MPFGTFNSGGLAQLKVGTADPPTVLLGGCKQASWAGTRPTSTDDFLNQQASDVSVGKATRKWDINGICSSSDTGLAVIKVAFDDDSGPIIYISGSLEGTKGESLPCRVSNLQIVLLPSSKATYSFTAEQALAPTNLAGGGIFD
jgi:hypothetical protein